MVTVAQMIQHEVLGWPGVTAEPHRFGGVEFRINHREIGHLHGSRLADLPLPKRIRDELVTSGRAVPHHVLPNSGWVSFYISGPQDVADAIALFRLNYDRLAKIGESDAD
ncbi:MAG: luciferase domain-containing protein [Armatimonadota bacterium]